MCDLKQGYTQYGGLRPFGVSFLFAGWDEHHGFQLYQSDPSGNYGGWKAKAIGANNQAAQSILQSDYKDGETNLKEAMMLAIKVLSKSMDTTSPTPEKRQQLYFLSCSCVVSPSLHVLPSLFLVEIATITKNKEGEVVYHVLTTKELESILKEAETMLKAQAKAAEGDM